MNVNMNSAIIWTISTRMGASAYLLTPLTLCGKILFLMGIDMTDLEIVKKCAEKMGYSGWQSKHGYWNVKDPEGQDHVCCSGWNKFDPYSGEKIPEPTFNDALYSLGYDPVHDDAQAMALVKRFKLSISREHKGDRWGVGIPWPESFNQDLNRAICECVARLPD